MFPETADHEHIDNLANILSRERLA